MAIQSRGLDDASQKWPEEQEGRFMVAVGAMIEHVNTGRVLLMKRSEHVPFLPGVWEDIGGRLKQFEEPEEALRREVREETGLEIEIIRPISVFHLFHGERNADNELIIITYWCRSPSDHVVLSLSIASIGGCRRRRLCDWRNTRVSRRIARHSWPRLPAISDSRRISYKSARG